MKFNATCRPKVWFQHFAWTLWSKHFCFNTSLEHFDLNTLLKHLEHLKKWCVLHSKQVLPRQSWDHCLDTPHSFNTPFLCSNNHKNFTEEGLKLSQYIYNRTLQIYFTIEHCKAPTFSVAIGGLCSNTDPVHRQGPFRSIIWLKNNWTGWNADLSLSNLWFNAGQHFTPLQHPQVKVCWINMKVWKCEMIVTAGPANIPFLPYDQLLSFALATHHFSHKYLWDLPDEDKGEEEVLPWNSFLLVLLPNLNLFKCSNFIYVFEFDMIYLFPSMELFPPRPSHHPKNLSVIAKYCPYIILTISKTTLPPDN